MVVHLALLFTAGNLCLGLTSSAWAKSLTPGSLCNGTDGITQTGVNKPCLDSAVLCMCSKMELGINKCWEGPLGYEKKKKVSVFSLRWRLSSAHLSSCRDVCPCPIFPYLKHHSKILPEKNNNKKTRYEVSLMSVSKPQVFILWLGEKLTLARTVLLHRKMVFWNYNPHAFFKTNSQGHKENTSMNNEPPVSAVCLVFRCWAEGVKKITSFGGAFLA